MAKQNRQAHAEAKAPAKNWLVAGIFGGILVVVAAVMFLSNQRPAFEPLVTGAARAEIDTMEIDHGTVKFEQPVESVFRIRNIGDEPLRIASDPRVELIEGC